MRRLQLASLAAACFALATLPGCGGDSKVKINGTLTKNGKPLIVSKSTYVMLKFVPADKPQHTFPARFPHDTGDYTVELPAGKYTTLCQMLDENNQKIPTGPVQIFDLNTDQRLNIDISPKDE